MGSRHGRAQLLNDKGVVATVAARLVDQGRLDYDDLVSDYWPEFAAAGKHEITVRHLLSHTAAMHRIVGVVSGTEMLDWELTTAALAAAPPAWEPGLKPGYHGITFGFLVGELIRRVTDLSVGDAIAAEICVPLGISSGMSIGLDLSKRHNNAELLGKSATRRLDPVMTRLERTKRFAEMAAAFHDPTFFEMMFGQEILDAEIPAVNGVFTARTLARMYASLIRRGLNRCSIRRRWPRPPRLRRMRPMLCCNSRCAGVSDITWQQRRGECCPTDSATSGSEDRVRGPTPNPVSP
ncbi:MAG: beta-lactamase family protein [Acidobacteria bacterium]|nr:beta-lactamase family protein [Acidobacteriota bacterium]